MDANTADKNMGSMRERELEVEVARLTAELAVVKGAAEPAETAARFLAMAASTVDQAMADARREVDEMATEVTAAAEARRDEATRVAEQVEAHTEALKVEAHNQQQRTVAARQEAEQIKASAAQQINAERARVADEVERLSDVRTALESERGALESYHEELKRRVQELAESMVSFMTTEPPLAAVTAIDELAKPAIGRSAAAVDVAFAADVAAEIAGDPPMPPAPAEPAPTEPRPAPGFAAPAPFVPSSEAAAAPAAPSNPLTVPLPPPSEASVAEASIFERPAPAPIATSGETGEPLFAPAGPGAEPFPAPPSVFDAFEAAAAANAAAPHDPPAAPVAEPAPTPSFVDMIAPGPSGPPPSEFAGVPVVAEDDGDVSSRRSMGGLFSRSRNAVDESVEPLAPEPSAEDGGLFGARASRLIEQTSPDQLASALADETEEDERFQSFLNGDDDTDPSRDWFLRPDADS
ncbi:MAG: hypothetical protein AAGC53_11780 [Actinomycetota bacterium]